jgi:hypothetical protein
MIYYTKFSENAVFEDARLNVFCNQLFTLLINRLDEFTVVNNLILDGQIALLMQAETLTSPFLKVQLSTSNKALFDLIQLSVGNLDVSSYYFEKDKLIVSNSGVFFEFTLTNYSLMLVDVDGIKLHDKKEILNERK